MMHPMGSSYGLFSRLSKKSLIALLAIAVAAVGCRHRTTTGQGSSHPASETSSNGTNLAGPTAAPAPQTGTKPAVAAAQKNSPRAIASALSTLTPNRIANLTGVDPRWSSTACQSDGTVFIGWLNTDGKSFKTGRWTVCPTAADKCQYFKYSGVICGVHCTQNPKNLAVTCDNGLAPSSVASVRPLDSTDPSPPPTDPSPPPTDPSPPPTDPSPPPTDPSPTPLPAPNPSPTPTPFPDPSSPNCYSNYTGEQSDPPSCIEPSGSCPCSGIFGGFAGASCTTNYYSIYQDSCTGAYSSISNGSQTSCDYTTCPMGGGGDVIECIVSVLGNCPSSPQWNNFNGADNYNNASSSESECVQRATDFYNTCGHATTINTIYTGTGKSTTLYAGCLVNVKGTCAPAPQYSNFSGFDNYLNASGNEAECVQRATDYYNTCGNATTVTTLYTPTNKLTTKLGGCVIQVNGTCPNAPQFSNLLASDDWQGASTNQAECKQRATDYYVTCGKTSTVTSTYTPTNTVTTLLGGCVVQVAGACPQAPQYSNLNGVDNWQNASSSESECVQRATDYSNTCGRSITVTSTYTPTGKVTTVPGGCYVQVLGTCSLAPQYSNFAGLDTWNNAGKSESVCVQRAMDYYNTCGNSVSITSDYTPTGKHTSILGGCVVHVNGYCAQAPQFSNILVADTFNNAQSSEAACVQRATDYWATCGQAIEVNSTYTATNKLTIKNPGAAPTLSTTSPTTVGMSIIYGPAPIDGMLNVYGRADGAAGLAGVINVVADTSSAPSTLVGYGTTYNNGNYLGNAQMAIPIRKGEYFQIQCNISNPFFCGGYFGVFTPFDAAVTSLGTRVSLKLGIVYGPATSDGLVSAFSRVDGAVGGGRLSVYGGASNAPTTSMATDYMFNNGNYLGNGQITVPIHKGQYYKVQCDGLVSGGYCGQFVAYSMTTGNGSATPTSFGAASSLAFNTIYGPAAHNGFITAQARIDGAVAGGWLSVVADTQAVPTTSVAYGYMYNNGQYLNSASMTVPILKGQYYQVKCNAPQGAYCGAFNGLFTPTNF